MKKPNTNPKHLKFLRNRAEKIQRNRIRHTEWRKQKNRKEGGWDVVTKKKKRKLQEEFWDYCKITAPDNFSFIKNPEGVINFIGKLEEQFKLRNKVYVVLDRVTRIDYGAIVVLLSIMVKFKANQINFNGDFPRDKEANDLLKASGFVENLFKRFKPEDKYQISKSDGHGIHTHAGKHVDAPLGSQIIESSSEVVWGMKRRCQGVQRVLVELMQNTNNHADIGKTGEKHWWLAVNQNNGDKKVRFSFVDYGVGIFENLYNKEENSKWYDWRKILGEFFSYRDDSELLKLILKGELHKTVTKKNYRGKGLPGVAGAMNRNQISNLYIISNNVYANVSEDEYKTLPKSFSGTYVYWELNEENENCGHQNQNS